MFLMSCLFPWTRDQSVYTPSRRSGLDLSDETQAICTKSVAMDNQIQVEKFSPWISCAEKKVKMRFYFTFACEIITTLIITALV